MTHKEKMGNDFAEYCGTLSEETEDMIKAMDEYYRDLSEENDKFQQAFKYYKEHCIVPFDKISDEVDCFQFDDGCYRHIGYCSVEKTDYHNCFYPNHEFYKVIEEDAKKYNLSYIDFMKQTEVEDFHTMVFQTTDGYCEDCYSGYQLFPMDDGRYWIVSFSIY